LGFCGYLHGAALDAVYKRCREVVAPGNAHETFGLTVIEAFSFAKPVFAFDRGAISGLLTDGNKGNLVAHDDLDTLSKKCQY
jgi:glycosyltransferase involved in cell wall biosynthesis